jgi:hypothetical protein
MTGPEQIDKLNRGEYVTTYELVVVMPDRTRVAGEVRYIIPLVPNPAEPLAQMWPLDPVRIVWDGEKWIPT